jgi:hypothetical protein
MKTNIRIHSRPLIGLVSQAFILIAAMTSLGFAQTAKPCLTSLSLPNKETLIPPFQKTAPPTDPDIIVYSVNVPNKTTQVPINVKWDSKLKLQRRYGGQGNFRDALQPEPKNGIRSLDFGVSPLKVGENIFEVKVIAADGKSRIYEIKIERKAT